MNSSVLNSKRKLYAIADQESCATSNISVLDFVQAVCSAGCLNLQYRDKVSDRNTMTKTLNSILKIAARYDAVVILNDFVDLAIEYNIPVHLGQEDGPVPETIVALDFESDIVQEKSMSEARIPYGLSTHSLDEIQNSLVAIPKPNYIAFGAAFSSATKPQVVAQTKLIPKALDLWQSDFVLIGGIDIPRLKQLPKRENLYYAVISAFFGEQGLRSVESYTKNFIDNL